MAAQLPAATANGATDTVGASEVDLAAAIRELTSGQGVDHGIGVVGKAATIRAAYDATQSPSTKLANLARCGPGHYIRTHCVRKRRQTLPQV